MPQLTSAATIHLRFDKWRRWPYHANVMNMFEITSNNAVRTTTGTVNSCLGGAGPIDTYLYTTYKYACDDRRRLSPRARRGDQRVRGSGRAAAGNRRPFVPARTNDRDAVAAAGSDADRPARTDRRVSSRVARRHADDAHRRARTAARDRRRPVDLL